MIKEDFSCLVFGVSYRQKWQGIKFHLSELAEIPQIWLAVISVLAVVITIDQFSMSRLQRNFTFFQIKSTKFGSPPNCTCMHSGTIAHRLHIIIFRGIKWHEKKDTHPLIFAPHDAFISLGASLNTRGTNFAKDPRKKT